MINKPPPKQDASSYLRLFVHHLLIVKDKQVWDPFSLEFTVNYKIVSEVSSTNAETFLVKIKDKDGPF